MGSSALRIVLAMLVSGAPASASAAVIDFSAYQEGTTFGSDLALDGAVFSSGGGVLKIVNLGAGNALCASNGYTCTRGLSVEFSQGAAQFAFTFSGDMTTDLAVQWEGETPFLSVVGGTRGDGDPATTQRQTFFNSRYDDLTRISITPEPGEAIAFNSFSFEPGGAVPEPATWATMLLGFGAIGASLRRRRPPAGLVAR